MTLKNFREIIWYPELFDRTPWDTWKKNRAKDVVSFAMEKEKKILNRAKPPSVSSEKLKMVYNLLKSQNIDIKKYT